VWRRSFPSEAEVVGRVVLRDGKETGLLSFFNGFSHITVRNDFIINSGEVVVLIPSRSLITRSLFLLKLSSPVVVDGIVVKGEGNKLQADVHHLQVEVQVGRLKVFMPGVFMVLGTESVDFCKVVIEIIPSVVVIKDESENLHHNNHD